MSNFHKFSKVTTIHGLYYASKERHLRKGANFVWPIIICVSVAFCLWQNYVSIQQYLSYEVATATYYEVGKSLSYPAISISNENFFKRTVVGRHQTRMLLAMQNGRDEAEVAKLYYHMNKTCYYEPLSHDQIDDALSNLDFAALSSATPDFVMKFLQFGIINEKMNFFKCYLRNVEIDCESIILTIMMDMGQGFSFNLDTSIAQNFIGNESGLGDLNTMYAATNGPIYALSEGIENGLKFILNVNNEDYCAYSRDEWFGAGFQMIIHDPKMLPSDWFDTSIRLSPGFQYSVAIKPIQYLRNTEHLGKCRSSFDMYMFPESQEYVKELCLKQCENEFTWQHCKCLSTWLRRAGVAFARHHKLDEKELLLACIGGNRTCLAELLEIAAKEGFEHYCPQCKQRCNETKYNYEMTITKFPPNRLLQYYGIELNVTDYFSISRNFLVLNIYFESSLIQWVVENQMFTAREMFIYIGSSIGLFLGMSFMSLAEILNFFPKTIHFRMKKSKNKKTRIRIIKIRKPTYRTTRNKPTPSNSTSPSNNPAPRAI